LFSNGINCGKEFEQKTYDGTVIKMRICHDEMQVGNTFKLKYLMSTVKVPEYCGQKCIFYGDWRENI
jgi:hypothetical protein